MIGVVSNNSYSMNIKWRSKMLPTIVQINYKLNTDKANYVNLAHPAAQVIAAVEGLQWKIWLFNEAEGGAGGIYLFDSQEAAQRFLQGPIPAGLRENPAFSDITVKLFETVEDLTQVTRGPIGLAQPA
jgi:hypothetical protein